MNEINLLHISNDFLGSRVHANLYSEISKQPIRQKIFVPLRDDRHKGKNCENIDLSRTEIVYSSLIKKYHRLFFTWKINQLNKDIEKKINLKEVQISHATTLFSDGAIALRLFKKYRIPYVVSVRITDIFIFLKYRPDLAPLAHEIMRFSSKIIFISESNKVNFFNHKMIRGKKGHYLNKSVVINNGIDKFWLNNINHIKISEKPNSILYVGKFDKNKNVQNLIAAVELLRRKIPNVQLGLVGGGGSQHSSILKYAGMADWINYYGNVTDKYSLLEIYRKHKIFAMVSLKETFGLVYIEALSQGLPIVFTKGQGVDGIFDGSIGSSANASSVEDICNALYTQIVSWNPSKTDCLDLTRFSWTEIAKQYLSTYEAVLKDA